MPTLDQATGTETAVAAGTAATGTETVATGVVDATVVDSKPKKEKKSKVAPATAPAAQTQTTPPAATRPKAKKEKKEASSGTEPAETSEKKAAKADKLVRPPMEIIAQDVEHSILDKKIGGHLLKKLPYKCGKLIFGLPKSTFGPEHTKDFRVIALKARKKSKNVEGKSRCIFYFGISADHSAIEKEVPGTKATKFGRCSVQCKKPIELVLDKTSYKEVFGQNPDAVTAAIEKLIKYTVEQKAAELETLTEKIKAKKEAAEKAKKKETKETKTTTE